MCEKLCINSEFKKKLKRTIIGKRRAGVVETSFQQRNFCVFKFWISEHHPSDLKSLLCDELCVLKFEIWYTYALMDNSMEYNFKTITICTTWHFDCLGPDFPNATTIFQMAGSTVLLQLC